MNLLRLVEVVSKSAEDLTRQSDVGVLNDGEPMRLRIFCFGVAATSAASLALSLLLTRIFSVTMYYHFAFLLISLALLGIAVSGVGVYLLPRLFRHDWLPHLAAISAIAIAPLTV